MFCKFCGKTIRYPEKPCPNCGKTQGSLRSTDGYFGVLESMKAKEEPKAERKAEIRENPIPVSEPVKKRVSYPEMDDITPQIGRLERELDELKETTQKKSMTGYKRQKRILHFEIAVCVYLFLLTFIVLANIVNSNRQMKKMEEATGAVSDQISNMENEEIKSLTEKIDGLSGKVKNIESNVSTLLSDQSGSEDDITELKTRLEVLQQTVDELKKKPSKTSATVSGGDAERSETVTVTEKKTDNNSEK